MEYYSPASQHPVKHLQNQVQARAQTEKIPTREMISKTIMPL
jgi:hypothetical protein